MRDSYPNRNRAKGFTLVELAVVVVVISLLLGALLIPLQTQIGQRNVSDTRQRLAQIHDALIAYAIAQGRFPCPASATGGGVESFAGGGTPANGNCLHFFDGYVPGTTLGLSNVDSQGYALDAWGLQQNRIRYAITNAIIGTTTPTFTQSNGMRTAGIQLLGTTYPYLSVCVSYLTIQPTACSTIAPPTNDPNALSRGDAVFVLVSLGKNAGTTSPGGPDEQANLAGTPVFVSKTASDQTANEFDDLVLWGSRYEVIGQLVSAGQLP